MTVDRVRFAYRYDTGYGPSGVGSNSSKSSRIGAPTDASKPASQLFSLSVRMLYVRLAKRSKTATF